MKIAIYTDDYREAQYPTLTYEGQPVPQGAGLVEYIEFLRGALHTITPVDAPILLEPAFPDYIINGEQVQLAAPVITWTLESMSPAKLGGKPAKNPESGVREVAKRFRTTTVVDDVTYEVYGQTLQAWIRFDIWATKAADAEHAANWFRQYFMEYYGPAAGAAKQWFHERKTDKEISQLNSKLHVRSLIYFVQFEEKTAVRMDKIQSIQVSIEQVNELS